MTGVLYDDTKARQQAEQLQQAHDALESRVKERTRELASALARVQDEVDERKKIEAERRALLQRIVHLQEAERARVARELHDNLGQHMVGVLLHLEGFQRRLSQAGNQEASHDLEEFRKVVDGLIKATHRQSWELRPAELDELGLEVALENYVHQWSEKTEIPVHFRSANPTDRTLEPEQMIAFYRVAQEALTNVARHAQASHVDIQLDLGEGVCISIRDNGIGFDPATVKKRLGLLGMQERLEIVGGTLTIDAAPHRGTCISACLP